MRCKSCDRILNEHNSYLDDKFELCNSCFGEVQTIIRELKVKQIITNIQQPLKNKK